MKRLTFVIIVGLAYLSSFAQTDSLSVKHIRWDKEKIVRGVVLKHQTFKDLFASNQNVTIIEVKQRRKIVLDLACEEKTLKQTSNFGKSVNAIAAINGNYFDTKGGGSADYTRSKGKVISLNYPYDGERHFHQKAAVIINDGKISLSKWDGSENWEQSIIADDVMNSGPLLMLNNAEELLDSTLFNKTRNPRSAIAVLPNKRILLITVDGRNKNAAGMSLFELQDFVRWLNAKDAINLDGGGSTTLWVNGKPENGVVNYPTDNKKWDHQGERKVANAILVKRK